MRLRWLGEPRLHEHAGAGAVRQLRGVASGDERPRFDPLTVGEHRLESGETRKRRVGAHALVVLQRDGLVRDGLGRLVDHLHHRGQRDELGVEPACGLCRRGADMRLEREFVLPLTRDLVALGDDFGRFDHRHVDVALMLDEPWILTAGAVHLVVLHERNQLEAAADGDAHAVVDNLFCGDGDRHQTGGALPVDRHAGDAGGKPGAQERLPGDVEPLRPLLKRRAHDDVVDFAALDRRALERAQDDMAAERLSLRVVKRAAIGLADRRTCG